MRKSAVAAALLSCLAVAGALVGCSTGTSAPTPRPGQPLADRYAVGIRTQTILDNARSTASRGDTPAHPGRVLATSFFYPAATGAISSTEQAGVPGRKGGFPLVVFAHGFDANPASYRVFLHTLAAAGYVVAAPTFPIEAAIAGAGAARRSYAEMANQMYDMSAVITAVSHWAADHTTWLSGVVDASNVAVVGHSDGAMTVAGMELSTGYYDSRPKAAIVLSGAGLPIPGATYGSRHTVPLLVEQATADPYNPAAAGRYLFDSAHGPRRYLSLTGVYHMWPLNGGDYISDLTRRVVVAQLDDTLKHDTSAAGRLSAAAQVPGYTSLLFGF